MSTSLAERALPSTPGSFLQPQLAAGPRVTRAWILFWIISLALLTILLINNAALDTTISRSVRWAMGTQDNYDWSTYRIFPATADTPWYRTLTPPLNGRLYARTARTWLIARDLGEVQLTLVLMAVLWIFNPRTWKAALTLAIATLIPGLFSTLIRMICGRLRPMGTLPDGIRNDIANHWTLIRGFWSNTDLSFPSGHATLAFSTAAVLTYFYPRGAWLFITLACICGLSRVVMLAHFPADVVAAAIIGWTGGWFITSITDRVLSNHAFSEPRP
jgi:membrane-associated phospholipid phosphatase